MTTFFISDLHLGPSHPHLFNLFSQFLSDIQPEAKALYILGDFYEYWIGLDVQTEFQQTVQHKLAEYSQQFPIYFMPGNRDFLLTAQFYQQTGCIPLNDPCWLPEHPDVLLLHGDSLCTDNLGYRCYRAMSHLPSVQKLFLKLPLSTRLKIAEKLRGNNLMHDDNLARDIPHTQLAKLIADKQPSVIIHGHSHYPLIELQLKHPHYTRYVLAAWGAKGNTLMLDEKGEFEFLYFA